LIGHSIERQQATACRAVRAGAEGVAGIDAKRNAARRRAQMIAMHDKAPGKHQGKFLCRVGCPIFVGNGLALNIEVGQAEAGSGFPEQDFEFRAFRRTGAIDAETPQLPGRNLDIAAFIDQHG